MYVYIYIYICCSVASPVNRASSRRLARRLRPPSLQLLLLLLLLGVLGPRCIGYVCCAAEFSL